MRVRRSPLNQPNSTRSVKIETDGRQVVQQGLTPRQFTTQNMADRPVRGKVEVHAKVRTRGNCSRTLLESPG